ncbi:hypothetical protein [Arenimonas sp.]|uniref:hypothetical protein n=1 Tax=Arenimonas sp. TaxID=1872635 RepID=UPI0039E58A3F
MKWNFFLAPTLALASATTAAACEGRFYDYSAYAPSDLREFSYGIRVDTQKEEIWIGHSGQKIRLCGEDSPFYCIHSLALNFAVPKASPKDGKVWSSGGMEFHLEGTETLNVLGESVKVLVVSAKDGVREHRYFYSEDRGLLGIVTIDKSKDNAYKTVFLLEQKSGFPF